MERGGRPCGDRPASVQLPSARKKDRNATRTRVIRDAGACRRDGRRIKKCNFCLTKNTRPGAVTAEPRTCEKTRERGGTDGKEGRREGEETRPPRRRCFEIPLPNEMRSVHGADSLAAIFSRRFQPRSTEREGEHILRGPYFLSAGSGKRVKTRDTGNLDWPLLF